MNARVVPFQPPMLDAVMNIWLRANRSAHCFVPAAYWESMVDEVRELLPHAELWVHLDEQGAVEGFLGLTDGGYIAGLFVDEARRSHGVGARLVEQAKQGRDRLELDVFVKNEGAVRFYRRCGFEAGHEAVHETGERELRMVWRRTAQSRELVGPRA